MKEDQNLKITFINIGYGDAVLIECPAGNERCTMLIDGGSGLEREFEKNAAGRVRVEDFLKKKGIRCLDVLVCTHIHEDHVCGLIPVAKNWPVKEFWQPYDLALAEKMYPIEEQGECGELIRALDSYRTLCRLVREKNGKVNTVQRSEEKRTLCPGLTAAVYGPSPENIRERMAHFERLYGENGTVCREELSWLDRTMNNSSIILMLEWAGRKILLPGDTELTGYGNLDADLKADIFKVGHHAQKNSLDEELLERISPRYAVICASSERPYHSVHPDILKLLKDFGAALFFTDTPKVPPYTDGLSPHEGTVFEITPDGEIEVYYL